MSDKVPHRLGPPCDTSCMTDSNTTQTMPLPRLQMSITSWLWLAIAAGGAPAIAFINSLRLEHVASVSYDTSFFGRFPPTLASALSESMATGVIALAIGQAAIGSVAVVAAVIARDDGLLSTAAKAGTLFSLFLVAVAVMLNLPGFPWLVGIIVLSFSIPLFLNEAVKSRSYPGQETGELV